ncbi:glycerophosphodiester phosphodiesterase [soil metagenome]
MIRVGHKGANAIVPGNTIASFQAAVKIGVDVIEFDVLRPRSDFAKPEDWRRAKPGPAPGGEELVVAHDWAAAQRRKNPLTLRAALDAFCEPPLDQVGIDLDLKMVGREDEVITALRDRDLLGRAMTSGTEIPTIRTLGELEPALSRGWTLPRVRHDWTKTRFGKPVVLAGMAVLRSRLPRLVRREAPALGVETIWIHHALASPALAHAAHDSGAGLIAWTVDDAPRMRELAAIGVDGLCSNDPRLFGDLD